jgi:hypothetical protein
MATKQQDDLVDAGSEYSFPASDPPSYMGGVIAGSPPHEFPPRKPAFQSLTDPDEAKPAGRPPQRADPARRDPPRADRPIGRGSNNP